MKRTYAIQLSIEGRKILDEVRRERGRLSKFGSVVMASRTPIAGVFHKQYRDARPPVLLREQAFSIRPRPLQTTVTLTDEQVKEILQLANDLDINLRNIKSSGKPTALLGQFLDAVLRGHLIYDGPERPTNDD